MDYLLAVVFLIIVLAAIVIVSAKNDWIDGDY